MKKNDEKQRKKTKTTKEIDVTREKIFKIIFGDRLNSLIHYLNYTQKDLAKMSGLSADKIHRLISGEQEPSASDLLKLSKALKVNPKQLLGEDNFFDNYLATNSYFTSQFDLSIEDIVEISQSKQIYILKDHSFFNILSIDIFTNTVTYLDTVNCVKVKKTEEEIERELSILREIFPGSASYPLEENKRLPQIKKVKFKTYRKEWM